MKDSEFWGLISLVDMVAVNAENCQTGVQPVINALSKKSPDKIAAFHEILSQKLFALDNEARCDVSCGSADGFLYQRCYIIAQGAKNYAKALISETYICDDLDWCESLLYVARTAWENTQSKDWDYEPSVSFETGSNLQLWG